MSPSPFEEKRLVMMALIGVANVSNKIAVVATQQDLVEVEGFVSLRCDTTLNFTQIQTALSGLVTLLWSFQLDVSCSHEQMNTK